MVKKISEDTKRKILEKSAYALPDRPSERGIPVSQIKNAFYKPILDEEASIVSEVNRIVDEINANNEGNSEVNELRNEVSEISYVVSLLQETKQDKLTAGDGIKIENNVISAIGGAPSGFKVRYYDGEYCFNFYTEEKLSNSDELMEYLRNNEYNYDNPLPVYDVLYNGCVDSLDESAGMYEEASDLYIRVPAYGEYWYVHTDGFDFSGGDSDEEEMSYYYCGYDGYVFYLYAPSGFHEAYEIAEWLQSNGYTSPDNCYEVNNCYQDGLTFDNAGIYTESGSMVFLHDLADHRDLCQIEYFDDFQENP